MLLIISSQIDPHVDSVITEFNKIGFKNFLRLDLGTSFHDFSISFKSQRDLSIDWQIKNNYNGHSLTQSNLSSAWWRRSSSVVEDSLSPNPSAESADINECAINTKLIVESINQEYFPFGHPTLLRKSENKFLQLTQAKKVNFCIPRFIFSNNVNNIQEFLSSSRDVVVKVIGLTTLSKDNDSYGFTATRINSLDLLDKLTRSQSALFIQDEIKRTTDVRVIFSEYFAYGFAISTDKLPENEIDWRPYTLECKHQVISIPDDIQEKCRQFLKLMNLKIGHFDFIVDINGNWNFLECNPNGQWLWLEQMTGTPLSHKFALALIK
jgi:hypothetical protein